MNDAASSTRCFSAAPDRRGSDSLKWSRYAGADILPMWVADMDFPAAPCVLDGIRRRLDHGVLGYAVPPAGLNDGVVHWLAQRHGLEIDPDWIVWLPGLVPAKSMACRCAGRPGDSAITLTPVYPPFLAVHRDAGMNLITVGLLEKPWRIDFDALEAAITPATRILLFCNPHNPVGRVWPAGDVRRLADICLRHDLLFCSDEIHCDLVLDENVRHFSALALDGGIREKSIVLMAASKTFNIPGLSLAWALVPEAGLRRRFRAAGGKLIPELNPLSYAATQAALSEGEPWRRGLVATLRAHRDRIDSFISERLPEITVARPLEATYLAWLDVRALGLADPHRHFQDHGVGLSNGVDFAAPGFLRLNFGCPAATLEEGLRRIEAAVVTTRKSPPRA